MSHLTLAGSRRTGIRLAAAAVLFALLLAVLAVRGGSAPAQAAGYWPYPTSAPQLQPMPKRCNLPLVGRTRACTGYVEYRDAFWDLRYGGPNSQAGVTAMLALANNRPADAAAVGRHAYYDRDRCAGVVRGQAMWMLNDMRDQDQLVDRIARFLWKRGKGNQILWKPVSVVVREAGALGKRERFRQQADKVLAGAFAADCA